MEEQLDFLQYFFQNVDWEGNSFSKHSTKIFTTIDELFFRLSKILKNGNSVCIIELCSLVEKNQSHLSNLIFYHIFQLFSSVYVWNKECKKRIRSIQEYIHTVQSIPLFKTITVKKHDYKNMKWTDPLRIVFSYLKSKESFLFSCRLVSHSWNHSVLEWISSHSIHLEKTNLNAGIFMIYVSLIYKNQLNEYYIKASNQDFQSLIRNFQVSMYMLPYQEKWDWLEFRRCMVIIANGFQLPKIYSSNGKIIQEGYPIVKRWVFEKPTHICGFVMETC